MPIKINTELLTKIREHIEAEPAKFRWQSWITPEKMPTLSCEVFDIAPCSIVNGCSTAACIGGWAFVLTCPAGLTLAEHILKLGDGNEMHEMIAAAKLIFGEWNPESKDHETIRQLSFWLFAPWCCNIEPISVNTPNELMKEEALRRIDWLLAGNNFMDYVVPLNLRRTYLS